MLCCNWLLSHDGFTDQWAREVWLNWLRRSLVRRNIKGMENISNEKTQSHAGFVLRSMSASNRLYFGETCQMRHGGCVLLPAPPPAARSRTFSHVCIRVSSGVSNSLLNLNEEHRDGLKNPTAPGPRGDDIITRWGRQSAFCCESYSYCINTFKQSTPQLRVLMARLLV